MSEESQTPISIEASISVEESQGTDSNSVATEETRSSVRRRRAISSKSSEKKPITQIKQKYTHAEAINEFYRLKDKYETLYYEKYVKPIVKNSKNRKQKRVEFSKLPKHECINCKRNVGTIFNISLTEFMFKKFIAKCGDLADPCPLDIQITSSYKNQYRNIIVDTMKAIEQTKLQIIKEKNSALFFNKFVMYNFEKLTSELKLDTQYVGEIIETDILKNNNPEKQLLLNKIIDEFGKEYLLTFKQRINKYMETEDELVLNEALEFYINEIVPKLKEIQSLKYDVNYVEYEENYNSANSISNVYKLIQLPVSLENSESFIEGDDEVLKFVTGVKKSKKATTMKLGDTGKNKTRKIKPGVEIVIEGEEDGEEAEAIPKLVSKGSYEYLEGIPDFDLPSGVKWDNEKYNELWKRIPKQLQELFLNDHEWLEEYMSTCVVAKQSGYGCELMLPKKTKIPPEKLPDGTYDFGFEILNKLFNKIEKSKQDKILSMYSVNNGITNYNMLRGYLPILIKQKLGIEHFNGY